MKALFLAAGFAIAASMATIAQGNSELSDPIFDMSAVIMSNAEVLQLTSEQLAEAQAWVELSNDQRLALEARAIKARAQLRTAIIRGQTNKTRTKLALKIGQLETKLASIGSINADQWRSILSKEQFNQSLELMDAQY
ncbi:hypothetical protein RXV86_10515 [Alisedimentitalea sp. MJ-SS2]|uniref:hypothetical protein n=1 Tax=Aliisedimentitalea sp. MJ-SS2 TaxID=3049795 RepID=UPI002914CD51|nr:hypothetical protein [Alisedimentitalea sp. MJ-SS2]MDU8927816.1 hypothetical protein [Alisedimentitalea sp. MJ-SS2]